MKRIFLVIVAALIAISCMAQPTDVEVIYSGEVPQTVTWEEVTTDINGEPLIEGDVITYEVFWRHSISNDEGSLGVVTVPESTIDISDLKRGYYYIGVRSIGETAEGAVEYSSIAWSNEPAAVDPTLPFAYLVRRGLFPRSPRGFRTETQ